MEILLVVLVFADYFLAFLREGMVVMASKAAVEGGMTWVFLPLLVRLGVDSLLRMAVVFMDAGELDLEVFLDGIDSGLEEM